MFFYIKEQVKQGIMEWVAPVEKQTELKLKHLRED